MVGAAEKAAEDLAADGIDVTLWDVRCCAPLDEEMIADAARHARSSRRGRRARRRRRHGDRRPRSAPSPRRRWSRCSARRTGSSPDGRPDRILARFGLDAEGIAATVRRLA